MLRERGALDEAVAPHYDEIIGIDAGVGCVMVLAEPNRAQMTRELLGVAANLTGDVLAVTVDPPDAVELITGGANEIVRLAGDNVEEDVARAVVDLARAEQPWAVLAPSTAWGREVAARVAAALDAGLTGDAVELELNDDDRLVAWKPAFGGQLVAAIGCTSPTQLVTVRAGVLPHFKPRTGPETFDYETIDMQPRGRVRILARTRDDDLDVLADADCVIGVGTGVPPDEYGSLESLRALLHAEIAATRKVTDKGWLPRARQIGITGRAIAPRLYVSIGASGKFNHMVGVRAAETVLAINPDPDAPVWDHADVGIVADWRDAVPLLVDALMRQD
jgi:electron transfer flavoprotein alpha subunit